MLRWSLRIELTTREGRPVYRQIADEIEREIAIGVLRPGEALPALRVLATELKVNPNTVQHAYRWLNLHGMVEVRRGQGTFVAQNSGGADERAALLAAVAERAARLQFG